MGGSSPLEYSLDKIIIAQDIICPVRSKLIFPHAMDGLRLWDAGIVIARYIYQQRLRLRDKDVIELGSGVGLSGIVAKLYAGSGRTLLTDYQEQVLENCRHNIKACKAGCEVGLLNWLQPQDVGQFDFVIASDVIYHGCPVDALFTVIKKVLRPAGQVWLMLPARKNYQDLCKDHLKDFKVQREDLTSLVYAGVQQIRGKQKYPLLSSRQIKFQLFTLRLH